MKLLKISCPFCGWPCRAEWLNRLHEIKIRILSIGGRRSHSKEAICEWKDVDSSELRASIRQQFIWQLERVAMSFGYRLEPLVKYDYVVSERKVHGHAPERAVIEVYHGARG